MACPNPSLFNIIDSLPIAPLSSWTKPRVRLIGTQEVLVEADSLNIDGAILANAELNEDGTLGEDKGNMSIDVAELNITDQKNKEESWSEGFSFSTSMGGNFEQGGKAGLAPGNGSTAVGANNSGHVKEGIAYGVLGKTKSLTVAGEDVADDSEILAGKHRDISETSVVTKEETTGGLNVDLTISNELFVGGQRQARDSEGNYVYDENGNAVMQDMNGFEILKNDIGLIDDMVYTKQDGLGGNLRGAAVNVGKVAKARTQDGVNRVRQVMGIENEGIGGSTGHFDNLVAMEKEEHQSKDNAIADVGLMLDKSGRVKDGHMTGFIQDENGNWYEYNQYADEENINPREALMNKGYKEGITLQQIDAPPKKVSNALQNASNVVYIKTTTEQDSEIFESAVKKLNTTDQRKYHLFTNNCVDSVQDIISAGGVNLPNDFDPRPDEYFEKLKNAQKNY